MDTPTALKSQYRSALAMLRQAIEKCPDDMWADSADKKQNWHIACHALLFAHLYLMPKYDEFEDWLGTSRAYWDLGVPGLEPISTERLLEYADHIDTVIDGAIDRTDLGSADSGFDWYSISKLEHEMVNIRHIQHHAAQIADRLNHARGLSVDWVG